MQKRNTQLTMKDIDASMVFGILVGVAAIIIAFPFLIVWALIKESSGSSEATSRSGDAPGADVRTQAEIDAEASIVGSLSLDPKVIASPMSAEYFQNTNDFGAVQNDNW